MTGLDPRGAAVLVSRAFDLTPGARGLRSLAGETGAALTGGFVRDAILQRPGTSDLDLCLAGDPGDAARTWASRIGGRTVPLDPGRGTWRVAHKTGADLWYWDFNPQRGETLEEDLLQRDFTVNAIALPLTTGGECVVDPSGGLRDLSRRMIRHIRPEAFLEDPLRRLRGWRFSAELDFAIDPSTLPFLAGPDLLGSVSGERVREELMKLLSADRAAGPARGAFTSGVLSSLRPDGGPGLGNLERIENLVRSAGASPVLRTALLPPLMAPATHGIPRVALLKLAALSMTDAAVSRKAGNEARRLVAISSRRLLLGRGASLYLRQALESFLELESDPRPLSSREGPWLFFDRHGAAGLGGLALFAACGGHGTATVLLEEMAFFHRDRYLPDSSADRLISAGEVSRLTGLPPGPALGTLLLRLRMARRLGEVNSAEDAAALALRLVGPRSDES